VIKSDQDISDNKLKGLETEVWLQENWGTSSWKMISIHRAWLWSNWSTVLRERTKPQWVSRNTKTETSTESRVQESRVQTEAEFTESWEQSSVLTVYIHECNTIAETAKRPRERKHQSKEHRRRRWLDGGLVNCGGAKAHRRWRQTAATTALARTQVGDKRHTERDRETRMTMHIEHRTHFLTLKSNKNRNNKEQQRTNTQ
jgi:hypothetical protein